MNEKIFDKPKEITLTNFRIFTKSVADRVSNYKTFYPYIPGLLILFSSAIANVETDHQSRKIGKSNYSLFKILKLVSRLLFNYSSYPLKLLTILGFSISLISFFLGLFYSFRSLLIGSSVPGWTTTVVLLSFFNGFLILMIGVLGEYLTRILNQLSIKHSYQIKETFFKMSNTHFFIVGAQRSGTTFIYNMLDKYDAICMAKPVFLNQNISYIKNLITLIILLT